MARREGGRDGGMMLDSASLLARLGSSRLGRNSEHGQDAVTTTGTSSSSTSNSLPTAAAPSSGPSSSGSRRETRPQRARATATLFGMDRAVAPGADVPLDRPNTRSRGHVTQSSGDGVAPREALRAGRGDGDADISASAWMRHILRVAELDEDYARSRGPGRYPWDQRTPEDSTATESATSTSQEGASAPSASQTFPAGSGGMGSSGWLAGSSTLPASRNVDNRAAQIIATMRNDARSTHAEDASDAMADDDHDDLSTSNSLLGSNGSTRLGALAVPALRRRPKYLELCAYPVAFSGTPNPTLADPFSTMKPSLDIPTTWNTADTCRLLEITGEDLEVRFIGTGQGDDSDAAAVRANTAIPPQVGVYYYEAEVISKGEKGYIGVGFCTKNVSLARLPGWETSSWGYHGDDGNSFSGQGKGSKYGPLFSAGDTIGCGIDFSLGRAFYTKNGSWLGYVFAGLDIIGVSSVKKNKGKGNSKVPEPRASLDLNDWASGTLYPCVGLRTPGECVRANFGRQPFVFDIEQYVSAQKASTRRIIDRFRTPSECAPAPAGVHAPSSAMSFLAGLDNVAISKAASELNTHRASCDVIDNYLAHHGLTDTLDIFRAQRRQEEEHLGTTWQKLRSAQSIVDPGNLRWASRASEEGIKDRSRIQKAIIRGSTDDALALLQDSFPGQMQVGAMTSFQLKCQHFVELLRNAKSTLSSLETRNKQAEQVTVSCNLGSPGQLKRKLSPSMADLTNAADAGAESNAASMTSDPPSAEPLDLAIDFGRQLYVEYIDSDDPTIEKALSRAFSILAYDVPETHPDLYDLFSQARREELAMQVNESILKWKRSVAGAGSDREDKEEGELERISGSSGLEMILLQTVACLKELGRRGSALAAHVDLGKEVLIPRDMHGMA